MTATKAILLALCLAAPTLLTGCFGSFASNQARRQAARSADHYMREYAEPDDPQARADFRQTRNDLADTIVSTGNERQQQKGQVGVDDRGWLTKENR